MHALTPVTFPLHPITPTDDGPACACAAGRECNRIGKHPAVNWRTVSLDAPSPGKLEGGGVGLRTGAAPFGSGLVVVDLDTADAAAEWDRRGGNAEPTRTVRTGRPGLQLYFQHPGFPVSNSVGSHGGLFPGIDVRGDGGFVVMPGSPHKSGRTYATLNPDVEIAPLPAWFVQWLRERPAPTAPLDYEGDVTDPSERARRRDLFVTYLASAKPCIAGHGGDQQLFEVVQHGAYDLTLPSEDVLALIEEHYDPRCEPPWGHELEERVLHKAHYAKTSSTRERMPVITLHEAETLAWLASFGKDARRTRLGSLFAKLGLLGAMHANGARDVDCLCGRQGKLSSRGRYYCSDPRCKFNKGQQAIRAAVKA